MVPLNDELHYSLDATPPLGETLLVGLQHVFAMFAGIVAPIAILSSGLGFPPTEQTYLISMALFASGLATLIQVHRLGPLGSGLLSVQGTSFTFLRLSQEIGRRNALVATGAATGNPGAAFSLILGMSLAAAPAEALISRVLGRVKNLFPPIVTGATVTLIGLTLIKVSALDITGYNPSAPDYASPTRLGLALLVLGTTLTLNRFGRGLLRVGSVMFGMLTGYLMAGILGMVDWTPLTHATWFHLPQPFRYGISFDPRYLLPWVLAYVVTSIESVGDLTATSAVSNQPIEGEVYRSRLAGGTLADAAGSILAGIFNALPNTTFSQNNGVIQLTGVASRQVGYAVAGILILLGLSPKVGALVSAMPGPVLGGATLVLFGMVAAGGIRILSLQPLTGRDSTVLATSLGVGLAIDSHPALLSQLPEWIQICFGTGLVTGTLVAMGLNLLLPRVPPRGPSKSKHPASSPKD
jgi:NCS2 family nucleobase:cation symporter-2/xanthine permease XanP